MQNRSQHTPTVETARLTLRAIQAVDLEAYQQAIYADPVVMRYLPGGVPRPIEQTQVLIEEFEQHWQQYDCGAWAILLKEDQRLIGHVGLQKLTATDDVEVFYALAQDTWGKGYAAEAAREALRWGFERCRLSGIIGLAVPENTGSRRVMEKIGMKYRGETDRYYILRL